MAFAPYGDPAMDAAHTEGSYARHYNPKATPPAHYTPIEKWAWNLGWRLQESLEQKLLEPGETHEGIPGTGT